MMSLSRWSLSRWFLSRWLMKKEKKSKNTSNIIKNSQVSKQSKMRSNHPKCKKIIKNTQKTINNHQTHSKNHDKSSQNEKSSKTNTKLSKKRTKSLKTRKNPSKGHEKRQSIKRQLLLSARAAGSQIHQKDMKKSIKRTSIEHQQLSKRTTCSSTFHPAW